MEIPKRVQIIIIVIVHFVSQGFKISCMMNLETYA